VALDRLGACMEDDSGCIVLHTLQLLDAGERRAVEYRVAVVQSRQDQTAGQIGLQYDRSPDRSAPLKLRPYGAI